MTRILATRVAIGARHIVMVALVLALTCAHATAQVEENLDYVGSRQVGPVGISPRITWQTEYEDNVFRSSTESVNDVVSTLGATSDFRGQVKRIGVTFAGELDWMHYNKLVNERGANVGAGVRLDFLLNRVVPYVTASYGNTRRRINPEIDSLPRVTQSNLALGGVFRFGAKTALDFAIKHTDISYEEETGVEAIDMDDALDRASDRVSLSFIQDVTGVTRVTVTGEIQQEAFDALSRRNADSIWLMAGLESGGRVRGHARAGMRVLKPHNPLVPESRGMVLALGMTAAIHDRLRVGVDAGRDVAPSYMSAFNYYAYSSFGGSVEYAIRRALRVSASGSRRVADYPRAGEGAFGSDPLVSELETRYESGITYQLGESMEFGFFGTYSERTGPRSYDGMSLRAGLAHAF